MNHPWYASPAIGGQEPGIEDFDLDDLVNFRGKFKKRRGVLKSKVQIEFAIGMICSRTD